MKTTTSLLAILLSCVSLIVPRATSAHDCDLISYVEIMPSTQPPGSWPWVGWAIAVPQRGAHDYYEITVRGAHIDNHGAWPSVLSLQITQGPMGWEMPQGTYRSTGVSQWNGTLAELRQPPVPGEAKVTLNGAPASIHWRAHDVTLANGWQVAPDAGEVLGAALGTDSVIRVDGPRMVSEQWLKPRFQAYTVRGENGSGAPSGYRLAQLWETGYYVPPTGLETAPISGIRIGPRDAGAELRAGEYRLKGCRY